LAAVACRRLFGAEEMSCWEVDLEGVRDKIPYPVFDFDGGAPG